MLARQRFLRVRRLAAVGLVAIVASTAAAACGDDGADTRSETMGMPSTLQELQDGEWVLDQAASEPAVDSPRPVTLRFSDDAVHGRGPCNQLRGTLEIDEDSVEDDSIAITGLAGTKMTCGDDVDRTETTYAQALDAVTEVDVDRADERMTLTGPGGIRLEFDRSDPTD
jgi:heat shock protein HslJ